ncbi:(3R)-hydroxymyristoyl-[acyl-carrier-protein] dehydratase [Leminorella grimontii]|nr:(3R)-hydroxymyristoyl-[acyl-carrier-protein] dehydratase [Leminorella grimontii]
MTTDNHTLDIEEILSLLPHRYPFLLVDRVLDFDKGKFLKAVKNVSVNEPFFSGTFPGQADFPWRVDSGSHGAGHRHSGV